MDENGMFMNVGDTSILSNIMSRNNFVFMRRPNKRACDYQIC